MMAIAVAAGYFLELLTLFGIVLIHELGHMAAAKSFGWRIRSVQLLPFGGVVESEESGTVPAREEIIVALAGPAQHVWMIAMAPLFVHMGLWDAVWANYFIEGNLMIGLFNLLPIPPLDGGRILQALVSYWISYHRTLTLCAGTGMILSGGMALAAMLFTGSGGIRLNLLAVGLFLLASNWYGYRNRTFHFFRFLLGREFRSSRLIAGGTIARPIVVPMHKTVWEIIRMYMRERYHLIYVMGERGRIRAVLPEQLLTVSYLRDKNARGAVSDLM